MSTASRPVAWYLHALDSLRGREIAKELVLAGKEAGFPDVPRMFFVNSGEWEDFTLNQARSWALNNPDGLVLYTHTKGAFREDLSQELWRGVMTDRLLRSWPARLSELENYDTSGVWWFTPDNFPDIVSSPYYAGNFWWARASYLASLPALPELTAATRFEAEAWLGRGNPVAKWMSEEWPTFSVPS